VIPVPLSYAIGNGKAKIILIKTEAVAVFYSHFTKTNAITTPIVFTDFLPLFKHNCSSGSWLGRAKDCVPIPIFAEIKFVFKNHNSHRIHNRKFGGVWQNTIAAPPTKSL
jgi:hypothetical protein